MDLVVRMKEDEEVHVRETTLLKFDGMDHCNHCPKEAIMDFLQESVLLFSKTRATMSGRSEAFCFLL